jgi:hypothetical protein
MGLPEIAVFRQHVDIVLFYCFNVCLRSMEINFDQKRLVEHTGVVERKYIEKQMRSNDPDHRSQDSVAVFRIKVSHRPAVYIASGRIAYLDYMINVGDTLKLYTKPLTSIFGNYVSDGSGFYTTHNPNHIYHLIGPDGSIVINFDRQKQGLMKTIWICGLCGVILFLIYLYHRPGRKNPDGEDDPADC